MTAAGMDVQTALSTIDRAIAYTQPLRRRTEGVTWILYGLASALFAFSYAWLYQNGLDPRYLWLNAWFVGYALLGVGAPLLTWRVAGVMHGDYALDVRRVVLAFALLALALMALNLVVWVSFGETQLAVAASLLALCGGPWALLGAVQWTRMSTSGRRSTIALGVGMSALALALVYVVGADASPATINKSILIVATTMGAVPITAGLWRLARG